VPDFGNTRTNQAQNKWNAAGFTTSVLFDPGPNNYKIVTQAPTGGTIDPQPGGCAATIRVGP
jgi:hypothetical protein